MTRQSTNELDHAFAALSDPTRRAILSRLMQGEASVTELAEPFSMSLPAVSKHLRVLEDAGLLKRRRDGRFHWISLRQQPIRELSKWFDTYSKSAVTKTREPQTRSR